MLPLIVETEATLSELENKQKLVQFQKRICFLCLLKDGTAKTQKQAGERVRWKLRQAQLDAAEDYVTEAFKEFLRDTEKVKSLTLYPYIKYAQTNLN